MFQLGTTLYQFQTFSFLRLSESSLYFVLRTCLLSAVLYTPLLDFTVYVRMSPSVFNENFLRRCWQRADVFSRVCLCHVVGV